MGTTLVEVDPEVVRIYQGDTATFDECMKQNGAECQPERL